MIRLANRDQARFGQLMLQTGQWQGEQIISQAWVEKSISAVSSSGRSGMTAGYAYLRWSGGLVSAKARKLHTISAQGNGGHSINIIPDFDLVAVVTPDTIGIPSRRVSGEDAEALLQTIVADYGA